MAKSFGNTAGRAVALAKAVATIDGKTRATRELIISESRTKAAAELNVSSDFFAALDREVRTLLRAAEARATRHGRRTLRPHDL